MQLKARLPGIRIWEGTSREFSFSTFQGKIKEWTLPLSNGLPMGLS